MTQKVESTAYSAKFKAAIAFLIVIGIINQRYVLRIIPYTREHKPYDDYKIKDFSNFWVTAVAAIAHIVVYKVYETLTLPFWEKQAKNQHDPELR